MNAWALAVVVLGILLAVGTVVWLLRQPNPADLSEQDGEPTRQGRHAVERPAGPGAESMNARPSATMDPDGGGGDGDPTHDARGPGSSRLGDPGNR
jgi:hypothetical protein